MRKERQTLWLSPENQKAAREVATPKAGAEESPAQIRELENV